MKTKDVGTNWKFVCKKDILQGWQKVAISLFGFGVLLGPPLDAIHSRVQLQIYDRGAIDVAGLHTNIWVSKYFSSHPSASTSAVNSVEWTPKRHALRWYWTMCSKYDNTLGSVLKAIGRVLWSFKEKENLHFDCSYILHVNSDSETWNDNLWKYLYYTFFMLWTLCGTRFSLCSAFSTAWWECCSLFLTRTWLEKAPYRKQTCRKWSIPSCEWPHSWNNITYTKVKFTHSTISGHQLRKSCRKNRQIEESSVVEPGAMRVDRKQHCNSLVWSSPHCTNTKTKILPLFYPQWSCSSLNNLCESALNIFAHAFVVCHVNMMEMMKRPSSSWYSIATISMHVDVGDIDQKYMQNVLSILNNELLIGSLFHSIS